MTQEQIQRLHELEDERHHLNILHVQAVNLLPDDMDVNKMDSAELINFVRRNVLAIENIDLLRKLVDEIMKYFFQDEETIRKRLAEIEKEIEEL